MNTLYRSDRAAATRRERNAPGREMQHSLFAVALHAELRAEAEQVFGGAHVAFDARVMQRRVAVSVLHVGQHLQLVLRNGGRGALVERLNTPITRT